MNKYNIHIDNFSNLLYSELTVGSVAKKRFTIELPSYLQDKFTNSCNIWIHDIQLSVNLNDWTNKSEPICLRSSIMQPNTFDTNNNAQSLTLVTLNSERFMTSNDIVYQLQYEGNKIFVNSVPNELSFWISSAITKEIITLPDDAHLTFTLCIEKLCEC